MKLATVASLFTLLTLSGAKVHESTDDLFLSKTRKFFVINGEFTYEDAKEACAVHKAKLATFDSQSQEHFVRTNLDFEQLPGSYSGNHKLPQHWTGQVWLGLTKKDGCWVDDEGENSRITPFSSKVSYATIPSYVSYYFPNQDCVVMREDGWYPMNCNATKSGHKLGVGALCMKKIKKHKKGRGKCCPKECGGNVVLLKAVAKVKYFLIEGDFTHAEAEDKCSSECGGTLALVPTKTEIAFVEKNIDFDAVDNKVWVSPKYSSSSQDSDEDSKKMSSSEEEKSSSEEEKPSSEEEKSSSEEDDEEKSSSEEDDEEKSSSEEDDEEKSSSEEDDEEKSSSEEDEEEEDEEDEDDEYVPKWGGRSRGRSPSWGWKERSKRATDDSDSECSALVKSDDKLEFEDTDCDKKMSILCEVYTPF